MTNLKIFKPSFIYALNGAAKASLQVTHEGIERTRRARARWTRYISLTNIIKTKKHTKAVIGGSKYVSI